MVSDVTTTHFSLTDMLRGHLTCMEKSTTIFFMLLEDAISSSEVTKTTYLEKLYASMRKKT
jgi:hypothetical protein